MCWRREESRRVRLRSQHGITRLPQVGSNQFNLGATIKWSDFCNFQGLKGLGCVLGWEREVRPVSCCRLGPSRIMKGG